MILICKSTEWIAEDCKWFPFTVSFSPRRRGIAAGGHCGRKHAVQLTSAAGSSTKSTIDGTHRFGKSSGRHLHRRHRDEEPIGGTNTDEAMLQSNVISANFGNGVALGSGSSSSQILNNGIGRNHVGLPTLPNVGTPTVVDAASLFNPMSGN